MRLFVLNENSVRSTTRSTSAIEVAVAMAQHRADEPPAVALLRGVEAGFPVDVAEGPRLEAGDELHRHEVVVRVDVGREVREVAVGERFLALAVRGLDDLPADRPAVAVRVEAPRVLLRVEDVGRDAAVEIRAADAWPGDRAAGSSGRRGRPARSTRGRGG